MLAPVVRSLAEEGWRVSVLSRRAKTFAAAFDSGVRGWNCDYHDDSAFERALGQASRSAGPITLAVAWFHTLKIAAPRRLALAVGTGDAPGRYFQILGSGVADPARPDRIQTAGAVAEGADYCRLRQIQLGFEVENGVSRWLTNSEIARGVTDAIGADRGFTTIGRTRPWSARPAR